MFHSIYIYIYICVLLCMRVYRSEEDSPNDYESSSHSEEERPSTQWPSVIVYPYSEAKIEQNVSQLGPYDETITHPARRG